MMGNGHGRFLGEGARATCAPLPAKATSRYRSFTYPQSGFALAGWQGPGKERYACLSLSKIGDMKVRLHRPMVGQVKTCTIKRDVNHWYVTFSCEVEDEPLPPSEEAVGIDLGVLHFATLSTGETIENPRHYRKGLKRIKLLSQIKDRRKKGSHRRKRAAIALAKAHRKVRNQRKDFQQKAARALVNRFGTLVFEDLKITNMSAAPEPKPDPENGHYLPNGAAAKAGLNQSIARRWLGTVSAVLRRQGCECRTPRAVRRPQEHQPTMQRLWSDREEGVRRALAFL
jgi:putative transposase